MSFFPEAHKFDLVMTIISCNVLVIPVSILIFQVFENETEVTTSEIF